MKPTTGVDQKRVVASGHGIGARLHRLLVHAVMGVGRKRGALSGLEIHQVGADGRAAERADRIMRFVQHGKRHAEAVVRLCRIRRRTGTPDRPGARASMAEIAVVTCPRQHCCVGMSELRSDGLQHFADADVILQRVGGRVHADHRVARAHQQPVERREARLPRLSSVGWLGLVAGRDAARQPDGRAEARDDANLACHGDQVLRAHDL